MKKFLLFPLLAFVFDCVELSAITKQDNDLIVAASRGDIEGARNLIECGASALATDDKGRTALMAAADEGHKDMVSFLITNGAAVNVTDNNGKTPLMYAAEDGFNTALVKLLIMNKAKVNIVDKRGWTAIMYAASGGYVNSVKMLVEAGGDFKVKAPDGKTAKDMAAEKDLRNVVDYLTQQEALSKDIWASGNDDDDDDN
ncbi:MAG: hypothetical protein A2020_09030 [Lentisphaerae bacterium GWF2_45_14]|nr:MAG: hypothetical protein A2020_09030 [Lentisphaerae bacterium GWF2_45_14]